MRFKTDLVKRDNVFEPLGHEWALRIRLHESQSWWTITTWNSKKAPSTANVEAALEVFQQTTKACADFFAWKVRQSLRSLELD